MHTQEEQAQLQEQLTKTLASFENVHEQTDIIETEVVDEVWCGVFVMVCTASVDAATPMTTSACPQLPQPLHVCAARLIFMSGGSLFLHSPGPRKAGLPPGDSHRSRRGCAGQCRRQHRTRGA